MSATPAELLKKYWGFDSFRPLQAEIIQSVSDGNDTLAILPTGGGKSITFQIPALRQDGMALVITPLIALMKDQVQHLKKRGIIAAAVHSGQGYGTVKRHLENAMRGGYKFLYVSPERLASPLFLEYLPYFRVNLIAVDEAHCISQWGYDFRPAYLRIAELRSHLPGVPVLALTASATVKVQTDICDKLEFRKHHKTFSQSYERSNLSYSVFSPPSKETRVEEIFSKVPGTGIAYCRSRKRSRDLAAFLRAKNIVSDFYHAGLTAEERSGRQDDWMTGKTRIVCCTNAFGMGIDKADVRSVVHYDLPDSLEYYYQEAGRAGRDGKKSYAVLLYYPQEMEQLRQQVDLRYPEAGVIRNVYSQLCSHLQLPAGKGQGQSFPFRIGEFIEKYKIHPIVATSVLKILEQEEILSLSENVFSPSTVEFFTSRANLEQLQRDFPACTPVIKGLLRSYEGILEQPCPIDEFILGRFIKMKKDQVVQILHEMHRMRIIEYLPNDDIPKVFFLYDRVPADDLVVNTQNILLRRQAYEKRLDAMLRYATQTDQCRSVFINDYFSGTPILPCGICDVCLNKKQGSLSRSHIEQILSLIEHSGRMTPAEIREKSRYQKNIVADALRYLKNEEVINTDEAGRVGTKT